jgi:hypothetical protein
VLRCEVVPGAAGERSGEVAEGEDDALVWTVRQAVRSGLRFDVDVTVVPTLDGDAPPIIDLRTWD